LANPADVLTLSVRRPGSLEGWLAWLRQMLEARQDGEKFAPKIQPNGASLHISG
jgi:hypothetical protein